MGFGIEVGHERADGRVELVDGAGWDGRFHGGLLGGIRILEEYPVVRHKTNNKQLLRADSMIPRKTGGRLVCDPFTDVPLYGLKVPERPGAVYLLKLVEREGGPSLRTHLKLARAPGVGNGPLCVRLVVELRRSLVAFDVQVVDPPVHVGERKRS